MSLVGKLEAEVEIKASPEAFHGVFGGKPHQLSSITPDKLHTCELHGGEFGKQGSLIKFEFTNDGKRQVVKHLIEKLDDENFITTFKAEEGDMLKEYKSCKFTVQAFPKGSGSLVHWSLEYEKKSEDTPDPQSMIDYCVHITKDTDAHLNKA